METQNWKIKLLDDIDQAMPPGAVLDVTLENIQNIAAALIKARNYIVMNPNNNGLGSAYLELKDAIKSASSAEHEAWLIDLQIAYFSKALGVVE